MLLGFEEGMKANAYDQPTILTGVTLSLTQLEQMLYKGNINSHIHIHFLSFHGKPGQKSE